MGLFLLTHLAAGQHKLRPYAGLHASGSADMYYLGPSGQLGIDYYFAKKAGLTAYAHYFRRRIDRAGANYQFEQGDFRCLTGALLVELHLGRNPARGTFAGLGLAVQQLEDTFFSSWWNDHMKRRNVLPALRIGYAFPLGKHQLTAEVNATGPYSESDPYGGRYTELLTQLSVGTRFVW